MLYSMLYTYEWCFCYPSVCPSPRFSVTIHFPPLDHQYNIKIPLHEVNGQYKCKIISILVSFDNVLYASLKYIHAMIALNGILMYNFLNCTRFSLIPKNGNKYSRDIKHPPKAWWAIVLESSKPQLEKSEL